MTLIDRLSKLDGPSGELDREICKHLGLLSSMTCEYNHWPLRVTSSVDDAIALAERMLPGWHWGITQGDDGEDAMEFQGNVWPSIQPYPAELEQYGYHKLPAVSLLIALLRAKEASR